VTIKEHMKNFHTAAATHHEAAAKGHRTLAKLFKAESGLESAADISNAHTELAECHDAAANDHAEMLKAVGDEMAKADLNRLVPDKVSSVLDYPPGVRAVPRPGSPDMSKVARVPEEFAHLVETDFES
jgi:hypothetical protein